MYQLIEESVQEHFTTFQLHPQCVHPLRFEPALAQLTSVQTMHQEIDGSVDPHHEIGLIGWINCRKLCDAGSVRS